MTLLLHILSALASIGYATYTFISPTKTRLYTSYGLVGLTVASGTILVWDMPASHIVQTCIMGLLYIAIVATSIAFAHHKLATVKSRASRRDV